MSQEANRWFVGLTMDEPVWNRAVFSKLAQPYLSDEHFTVDGRLIEAWASHKSFRRKDGEEGPRGGKGGWMKIIGMLQKVKLRGLEKVSWLFTFVGAAYNLYRLGRRQEEATA